MIPLLRKDGKKRTHNNSQKTSGFLDKIRIGAGIANQMPQRMGASECAAAFGISTQMLRRIECLALFKVQARLKELAGQER